MLNYKKILLINPYIKLDRENPIAILDMAPYFRKCGIEVDVCNFPDLPEFKDYDMIGISCISSEGGYIFEQLKVIREHFRGKKIVIGGKWSTTMTEEEALKLQTLNIEVETGKGELVYTNDKVINFEKYPSWDKNDFEILCANNIMMTSRGCPFHCNFCNNTEEKVSYFTAKRTVDNLELILSKNNDVYFVDDIFVTNYEHAKAIYDECKRRKIKIENHNKFFVHLNTVNDKTIKIIKLFKPKMVNVGIESGNDSMLKKMNKKTSVEKIRKNVKTLSKYTNVHGLWMVGYPYETIDTLKNSWNLMKELAPYIHSNWISHYIPLYATVGYHMAMEEGGKFNQGIDNRHVAYIPKGLTQDILIEYRTKMMQFNNILFKRQNIYKYYFYKIVSKISIGKLRKKVKAKYKTLKSQFSKIRQLIIIKL